MYKNVIRELLLAEDYRGLDKFLELYDIDPRDKANLIRDVKNSLPKVERVIDDFPEIAPVVNLLFKVVLNNLKKLEGVLHDLKFIPQISKNNGNFHIILTFTYENEFKFALPKEFGDLYDDFIRKCYKDFISKCKRLGSGYSIEKLHGGLQSSPNYAIMYNGIDICKFIIQPGSSRLRKIGDELYVDYCAYIFLQNLYLRKKDNDKIIQKNVG